MCGRYHIKYETYGELGRILGESEVPEDITGDINPSDVAPVIHRKNGKLSLDKMRHTVLCCTHVVVPGAACKPQVRITCRAVFLC